MVAIGLLGLWLHRGVLERRFRWAFALLALVGIGSMAFHATLRFELQMLDELPMLYLVLSIVYILGESRPAPRWGPVFPAMLLAYAAIATALCTLTRGQMQFIAFQISFGALELGCLARTYFLYRRSQDPSIRQLFRLGMGAYALGVSVWFVDTRFCEWVSPWKLHAAWHVLVSAGFYALLLVIAFHRLEVLGRRPALRWRSGIPRILLGHAATDTPLDRPVSAAVREVSQLGS